MTRYEPMGTSSAVTSVLHTGGMRNNIEVTKAGSYIYRGDASNFHEWEFRTRLRLKAAGDDEGRYAEQMSKVVDGLQGDVLTAAREVGLEKLRQPGRAATEKEEAVEPGIDILMKAIKAAVFPSTTIKIPEPPEPLYAPTPRCLRPCRQIVPINTRGRGRRCNRPCKRSNRHTDSYCNCLWHFSGFSKERAIEAAKQLVEKYERLDTDAEIDLVNDVKEAFEPSETSKDEDTQHSTEYISERDGMKTLDHQSSRRREYK